MEMKTKIDCVCEVFDTMLSCFKSEISNGLMNVDAKEAGEVADIIKDMSETEKNLREANYYKLVSEAMEDKKNTPMMPEGRMGYNWNEKPYIDGYLHDPEFDKKMGYVDGVTPGWGSNYMDAKKHYTETHSSADRDKLMKETISTVKEMWGEADPAQRAKMKTDLSALVNSLNA